MLKSFSFPPFNGNVVREETAIYGSSEFSDYALLGKNGKPLAVVEAKKSSTNAELGREQAKQYCHNIQDPLSPHFFDLIVIDESHRSINNSYGEVLNYFHTIKPGLTATPRDVVDHN